MGDSKLNPTELPLAGMPRLAPAYVSRWKCLEMFGLHVVYETSEQLVRAALAGTPFDYVNSRAWSYAGRLAHHDLAPADEAWHYYGVYVAALYKGKVGRFPVYMYADNVEAILAGRELLGEPKKWADIEWTFDDRSERLSFSVSRRGQLLAQIKATVTKNETNHNPLRDLVGDGIEHPLVDLTVREIPSADNSVPEIKDVIINPADGQSKSNQASVVDFQHFNAPNTHGWLVADRLSDVHIGKIISVGWHRGSYENGRRPNSGVTMIRQEPSIV